MSFQMVLIQNQFFTMRASYFAMRLVSMMFQQCFIGKIFSTQFAEMIFFIFLNILAVNEVISNTFLRFKNHNVRQKLDNRMLLKLFRMIGLSCWIFADMFSHHMLVKMKFREKHCFGTNLTKISAIFNVMFQGQMSFQMMLIQNQFFTMRASYFAMRLVSMMFQQCFIGKIFSTGFAEMSFFIFVNAFFMWNFKP